MSGRGASFDDIIERERGLRRSLSARRLTMIALGGAIGTGLFLGSGFAISLAGPAVLPGFAYQLGNLAMAKMAPIQAGFAESHGGDYAYILAWTLAVVAAALIIVTVLGPERRSVELRVAA